ncbi:MAG TPA: hypothetical protein VFU19_12015 [Iamia sp.]|nr:hypothetical protein [Iamia sp.]
MRGRRVAVVAVALGLVALLPGCSSPFNEVLVVGRDDQGTPVVGAVDCSFDDRIPAEVLTVTDGTRTRTGRVLWRVERPGVGRRAPEVGPPAPPAPAPAAIGGVALVAVGDPRPPGGDAAVALAEPLPDQVWVEAMALGDDLGPFAEAWLRTDGPADTYTVVSDTGPVVTDVEGAAAAAAVDDECDDDIGFDGAVFALITGVGVVVVGLLAVPVIVLTVRQFGRAGEAARAAESRRRAPPAFDP